MSRHNLHQPDYVLAGLLTVLVLFGLVMLSSAGSVLGFQRFGDSNYFLKKQVLSLVLAGLAFFIAYRLDYHFWQKWAVPIMFITVVALLVVFLPGIGSFFLGAHRWIILGPITIQPSELAKLTIIMYLAIWFERRQRDMASLKESLWPYLLTVGVLAGLIVAEPDLGTTIIVVGVAFVLYMVAGGPWRHIAALVGGGIILILLVINLAPYRAQRFTVFLNPELDPLGGGYHINQAKLAIGAGGVFGLGLGHSRQKFNYLPEPAGDSIFAITAEELGFIMVLLFIVAWLLFVWRGLMAARSAPDEYGRLLAVGITSWLGMQAFLNMGAISGVLPLTGIPLPFMSHGGSALVVSLAAVGILLNISRQTVHSIRRP